MKLIKALFPVAFRQWETAAQSSSKRRLQSGQPGLRHARWDFTEQTCSHSHLHHNHHSSWSVSSMLFVFQVMMVAAVILSVKDLLWMSRRDRCRSCLISGSSSEFIRTEWKFSPMPGTAAETRSYSACRLWNSHSESTKFKQKSAKLWFDGF